MNMHKTSPFMIEFIGTPEAGKTTTIHRLKDLLLTQKYSVNLVRESAEIVPTSFPKGSTEAHFWMRLTTAKSILENQVSNESDIILIDRGLIDTLFWDTYYGSIGTMSTSEVSKTNAFFQSIGIKYPDLVVYLSTTPEETIRRRGGEGRIVTYSFVKQYNKVLDSFIDSVTCPVFHLDTTNLSQDEVTMRVLARVFAKL